MYLFKLKSKLYDIVEYLLDDLFSSVFKIDILGHFFDQIFLFSAEASGDHNLPTVFAWINWFAVSLLFLCKNSEVSKDSIRAIALELELKQFIDILDKLVVDNVKELLINHDVDQGEIDDDVVSIDESDLIEKEIPTYQKELILWNKGRLRNKNARLRKLMETWKAKVNYIRIWLRFVKILKQRAVETKRSKAAAILAQKPVIVEVKKEVKPVVSQSLFVTKNVNDPQLNEAGRFFEALLKNQNFGTFEF